MARVKNEYHDDICRNAYFADLGTNEASDCEACDGFGGIWNNGDPGSGQRIDCAECGDTRGRP